MLRRFLLTLLSSWIVNPLGILVAQWFGVANAAVVILVLLATGACVPFQLLMNECIAAAESRGQACASRGQLGLLLAIQSVACALTVAGLAAQRFPITQIVIVVGFLAINTGLSYRISLRYFRMVTVSAISLRAAVVAGIIPGVTSLLLYLAYCVATLHMLQVAETFIVASTVVPSLVQWLYLHTLSTPSANQADSSPVGIHPEPATGWLLAAAAALAALAAGSTLLREMVAHLSTNHVALLLVALNSLLSLVNTATRAKFLVRGGGSTQGVLGGMVGAALLAFGIALLMRWRLDAIFALIAVQASIAWVIEAARRIPLARTRPEVS